MSKLEKICHRMGNLRTTIIAEESVHTPPLDIFSNQGDAKRRQVVAKRRQVVVALHICSFSNIPEAIPCPLHKQQLLTVVPNLVERIADDTKGD